MKVCQTISHVSHLFLANRGCQTGLFLIFQGNVMSFFWCRVITRDPHVYFLMQAVSVFNTLTPPPNTFQKPADDNFWLLIALGKLFGKDDMNSIHWHRNTGHQMKWWPQHKWCERFYFSRVMSLLELSVERLQRRAVCHFLCIHSISPCAIQVCHSESLSVNLNSHFTVWLFEWH